MFFNFIINKFKFYTAFFSDEEVANVEESRSFEDMETYFNLLVTKYSKVVGEVPNNWKGWEESKEESSKEDGGEDEKGGPNKGRKNKKNENKRKMRRKLL